MVGTDAFDMEKGLVRFEVYKVIGEDALIIHETFTDTKELQFHLSKGTAHKYKKEIDKIAVPETHKCQKFIDVFLEGCSFFT